MKNVTPVLLLVTGLSLTLNSCGPSPSPTATPEISTPTPMQPTATSVPPTPLPQGETIIITSTADSGPGTLRQALEDAQSGDTITFDPDVFPPNAPTTIYLTSGLPPVTQGYLSIDASNAGVVLEGSNVLEGEWTPGLEIISEWNTIHGLQIINFSGAGIILNEQAHHNIIGGDRGIGSGPIGQGNLSSSNGVGIGLSGACGNIITGNLIGTDATATDALGNQDDGIFIENGASNNVIGPGNIIAHNSVYGIEVRSLIAIGNEISQNSIYDNTQLGIDLPGSGDATLLSPVIFDYDLEAGSVSGGFCANCTIEIFSDNSDEGEIYEGRTTADDAGAFTLNKDAPFTGPYLTATATDAEGNTSEFSVPTTGMRGASALQEGNNLPKTKLQPKQSSQLEDNRIGGLWDGFWAFDMDKIVDEELLPMGQKRVKLAINGISWDTINWSKPELTIDVGDDEIFTRVADNGVTITYVLTFWDKAQRAEGKLIPCPRFKTEEEIQRYLDFVRFIVNHFKDRVQYFEIWNEPEMGWDEVNIEPCIQAIEVEDYINLVRRAVPVIREEYPDAKIVVGSTMPQTEPGSREYLLSILSSDIMPLVDVVAWHPGGPSPEYDYWRENYYKYPSLIQEIKDLASANGFRGEYSADEFVWWTLEDFPSTEPWIYSDTVSAKYYARFIIMHLGMDVTVLPGGASSMRAVSFHSKQNLCTLMPGAETISLPVDIQSEAENIKSYSFSLPNGEKLFALWADGVAVDADPGVKATLTFWGITANKVMGIDILNSFEQKMITDVEDGTLVVRDLLVKDYPIILRFTDNMSP